MQRSEYGSQIIRRYRPNEVCRLQYKTSGLIDLSVRHVIHTSMLQIIIQSDRECFSISHEAVNAT